MGGIEVTRRNNVTVTGLPGGPVVMLANGFGCDQAMWRLVTPGLERDFRVIRFDHVGSGRSDLSAWQPLRYSTLDGYAQDILEICRGLDLEQITSVGQSVSAMIVQPKASNLTKSMQSVREV